MCRLPFWSLEMDNMSTYLGDPEKDRQILIAKKEKRGHLARYNLMLLLGRLDMWPLMNYLGKDYPMNPITQEFQAWLERRRDGRE